jgi:hypothetical protein
MNTVTLESLIEIANKGWATKATIFFGHVGRGTKTHIIRKNDEMNSNIYTLCGAERVSTMSAKRTYCYTITAKEVLSSTLCGRCLKAEGKVA